MSIAAGSDLVMVSKELTFSSGAPIGDLQCVDITILNDTDVECDDVFNVTLTATDSNVDIVEGYGVATLTIERDAADGVLLYMWCIDTYNESVKPMSQDSATSCLFPSPCSCYNWFSSEHLPHS